MKVYAEKRLVIELSLDEAKEFYSDYHPAPKSIGKKLDAAVRRALDDAGAWDAA